MNNLEAVKFVKEHLSDTEKVNLKAYEQQINTLGATARDYVERFNNEIKQLKTSASFTEEAKKEKYEAKRAEAAAVAEEFGRQQFNLKNDITKLLKDSASRQAEAGQDVMVNILAKQNGGMWDGVANKAELMRKAADLLPGPVTYNNKIVYFDTLPFLAREINTLLASGNSRNPFY